MGNEEHGYRSENDQILSAIESINYKLDGIKDSLHDVRNEMVGKFSALEAWKTAQEPVINKLEAKVDFLDRARQEAEKLFAENRVKDRITTWVTTAVLTLAGSAAMHMILHTSLK
jgi:hypothetical protein